MVAKTWPPASVHAVGVERTLKTGQTLFRLGSRTAGPYEVVSGKVRLVRVDSTGREAVLYVATAGDALAESSLFSSTYHCDAIASTHSIVRLYPKSALLAEFRRNPQIAEAFMARFAHQVMSLRTRLQLRDIRSARERVRDYLTLNVGADSRTVSLSGTLKELAAFLGLTHEALYRTLAEMASDRDIERSGKKITLSTRRK
jgi:CRP-like cAMP-binding protein